MADTQQRFGAIAKFTVKTTFDFPLENLILARKYSFHEDATAPSRGTLAFIVKQTQNIRNTLQK